MKHIILALLSARSSITKIRGYWEFEPGTYVAISGFKLLYTQKN